MNGPAPRTRRNEDVERAEQVARLYLIVLGRLPDPEGFDAYVEHLRNGKTVAELADDLITGAEFRHRSQGEDPARVIMRGALGQDAAPLPEHERGGLVALVTALIQAPDVQRRLPVWPRLYPAGIPVDDPEQYRFWLARRKPAAVPVQPESAPGAGPVISLIALLDRPKAEWLAAMVASVMDQTSPGIELLVATPWRLAEVVRRIAARNPRLRQVWVAPGSSPASRFNRALARCDGTFVGLIGQHDLLSRTAMAELATIAGSADIVVADDDRADDEGRRHSPRLGTAWDPDRVIASGCPGWVLIRADLLRRIGGMRPTHGLEEWDYLLRASVATTEARVRHLPSVLLSRRHDGAVHGGHPAHRKAARQYLSAAGHGDCAVKCENGTLRVVYPVPTVPPPTSIIIPVRDRADLLRTCMAGLLRRTDYPDLEVLVIDNGTVESEALALLHDLSLDPRVRVLAQPGPFNWSALNNVGVSRMRGEIAVLLNNDIEVIEPGWLRELVSHAIRPEVGVVGAKLLYPDRTIQHAGIVLGPDGRATHMWRHAPGDARGYLDQLIITRQVTALTGACLAVRRDVYLAVGGCDAEGLPITWNDADLCLRIRARGLRAIWCPHVRLLHLEQATRGSDDTPERRQRFAREYARMRVRWNGALDRDPFLNPSLIPSEFDPRPYLTFERHDRVYQRNEARADPSPHTKTDLT